MSKTVLITGASTGIGRATALLLAREGFTVFAGVRKDADAEALGGTVTPIKLDVTDPGQITAAAQRIGRLDALVNNAGIGVTGPLEHIPLDALRRQYEVNVFGQVAVTQAMLPMLRVSRGRIVTVGSVGSWITLPFGGPLCSSKHAIRSLNDALRMEVQPWGIRAVLIEPGSIHSDAVDKLEGEVEPRLESIGPEGRRLYEAAYRTMTSAGLKEERSGSSPDVVARAVLQALTARKPRARYPVGKKSRLMSTLGRIVPQHTLDALRLRALGLS
ncbi:NAD(P)-dependent dehydrogenase (short-subunit alcohol dehydrogenase family) [Actinoplanes campanulatus]|uniref:NAD(P)-dependent dehydrogenase (Short-subunit alcohol dehydrogenase family) n=1 Tax=Actinoplanes campanulatus TaxID=113559 RepID=A0A7W5AHL9_9ACTN|nr:SDR family oxidoreductase [Actinoplanes campanulatus]MBB3095879.1 NAD(P)-dependent dehydrogenase (short-subunit alcohol dehydrogenase family) [Actinoplanes campanulatus]GGN12195.1 short-chain dehydrogenase/reductase [Actinoplanes campanulatus]GID37027.1 short-chain dehydrogenase/reductase [Actinoplanes campanulatus]